MFVKNEIIKFNGLDVNINISLGSILNQVGEQQAIDNLTQSVGESLINPIVDGEVRRFNYMDNSGAMTLNFFFYYNNQHQNTFIAAGFSDAEISKTNLRVLNSFYILDFYDTFDTYTQTKLFSTYLTKINDSSNINKIPKYVIQLSNNLNQIYYLNIPQMFIDKQTGNTTTIYVKFSFFNAKTGKIVLFYNKDNDDDVVIRKTPEKMYFKVILDLINMTWKIDTPSFNLNYNVNAYESPQSTYVDRIDNTVDKFDNMQQNYPSGSTFNSKFGNYSTII